MLTTLIKTKPTAVVKKKFFHGSNFFSQNITKTMVTLPN